MQGSSTTRIGTRITSKPGGQTGDPPAEANPRTSLALVLPDRPSVAVLPFSNLSGDPEQDYFADGVVEDIIAGLSRIKWLFVAAGTSSFIYKGGAVDVKRVGRELGVRYLLQGSFRKDGNRVRSAGCSARPHGIRAWINRDAISALYASDLAGI